MATKAYRPITLLTDFGHHDTFVGIMKGVILRILPQASIIDICHDLPSYDIAEAAFLLYITYSYFPAQSIHLVVVDPGVGSPRRPLLVAAKNHFFVAPDNGVLSYIFEKADLCQVYEITAEHYFLSPLSATFHGRDIFAPVAAYLSKGIEPETFGSKIDNYLKIPLPFPRVVGENVMAGEILHVDRFGNLITNISHEDLVRLQEKREGTRLATRLGDTMIEGLRTFYGEGDKGKLEALIGSSGYLEIFVNQGNASLIAKQRKGNPVWVSLLS